MVFRDPGNFAHTNTRMKNVKQGDIYIVRTDRFYDKISEKVRNYNES